MDVSNIKVKLPVDNESRIWAMLRATKYVPGRHSIYHNYTKYFIGNSLLIGADIVSKYFNNLKRAGIISGAGHVINSENKEKVEWFEIKNDPGAETPRFNSNGTLKAPGSNHETLWQTMRMLKKFTMSDLESAIPFEIMPSINTQKKYVSNLLKSGYLIMAWKSGHSDNSIFIINQAMNKGPLPPVFNTVVYAYDPDRGDVTWPIVDTDLLPPEKRP
ncbi:hypothetical protein KAR91_29280 [Candidatus Pacearchaeota archaeon]|nr:hypothetical protein [Candidatus Pacearchaeota archaeon]